MGILIQRPGVLMTVQDLGRFGYQAYGVSPAGALDRRSARLANALVGNPDGEGLLELTLGGAEILFDADNVIALCGAPMPAQVDQIPVQPYQAFTVRAGQTLTLGYAPRGMRGYIAFSGGLDIPLVMGSRSTYLKSGLGGFHGRKLQKGDAIAFRAPRSSIKNEPLRRLKVPAFPKAGDVVHVRILFGPQDDYFTSQGRETMLRSIYTITTSSDRMGYRLEGEKIEQKPMGESLTDGIVFGSIQVPPSGMPIIMMADRQTTGGYPKIATVITEDLPLLAQCPPGTQVQFVETTIETAQSLCRDDSFQQQRLQAQLQRDCPTYQINVNGSHYQVKILPVP